MYNYDYSVLVKEKLLYIYVYNTHYTCFLKINKKLELNIIGKNILAINCNNNARNTNAFLRQFFLCDFTKIKFMGKGYKIKKNADNNMFLLFNRSHITNIWYKNIFVKKYKKYKIYIKHVCAMAAIQTILNVRPVNIFTKKGLRSSRQIIYKKKGKK
jgi:hypothetical protein